MGKGRGKGECIPAYAELQTFQQVLVIISCCIGPAILIAGIVLLALVGPPVREEDVQSYNTAATMWDTNSKDFQSSTFSFNGFDFGRNTHVDVMNDPGPLDTYTQFSYIFSSVPLVNVSLTEFEILSTYPVAGQIIELGIYPAVDTFTLLPTDLNCRLPTDCDNLSGSQKASCLQMALCSDACKQVNGSYADSGICTATYYLNSLCFKLSQPSGFSWLPDDSYGNFGCYYKGKTSASDLGNLDPDVDSWTPAIYGPQESSSVTVVLRQANDPFILASFLTFGTYDFGETQIERMTNGIILVVIGGVCIILVIIADYFFIRWVVSSGRGDKKKFRDGGLESRSGSVALKNQSGHPHPHVPTHHPQHPPRTHIIDIYTTPKKSFMAT